MMPIGCTKEDNCKKDAYLRAQARLQDIKGCSKSRPQSNCCSHGAHEDHPKPISVKSSVTQTNETTEKENRGQSSESHYSRNDIEKINTPKIEEKTSNIKNKMGSSKKNANKDDGSFGEAVFTVTAIALVIASFCGLIYALSSASNTNVSSYHRI